MATTVRLKGELDTAVAAQAGAVREQSSRMNAQTYTPQNPGGFWGVRKKKKEKIVSQLTAEHEGASAGDATSVRSDANGVLPGDDGPSVLDTNKPCSRESVFVQEGSKIAKSQSSHSVPSKAKGVLSGIEGSSVLDINKPCSSAVSTCDSREVLNQLPDAQKTSSNESSRPNLRWAWHSGRWRQQCSKCGSWQSCSAIYCTWGCGKLVADGLPP